MIMGRKHANIHLSEQEEQTLRGMINKGTHSSRVLTRAQILLRDHEGNSPPQISQKVYCSEPTVYNVLRRYREEGVWGAITEKPRPCEHRKKVNQKVEGTITAIACSDPPQGFSRWTLRMIRDQYIELNTDETLSHETVRTVLKKAN